MFQEEKEIEAIEHDTNPNVESCIESCFEFVNYFDVALLLFELYKHTYVVTNIRKKTWFAFKNHIWSEREIGPYTELSTHVLNIFKDRFRKMKKAKNKKDRKDRLLNCEKIIQMLGDPVEKENICRECLYVFYDNAFLIRLDSNAHLIPFRNGVLDIRDDSFRDGMRTDYVSIYINDIYIPTESSTDTKKQSKLIRDFVEFRQKHVRRRSNETEPVYFTYA